MIIATPSGGIKGGHGAFPPVGGSLPTPPPSLRRKKIPKSVIFGEFVDFWPSESHFALSMPRHKKKKSGVATGHTIWWINRILNVFLVVVVLYLLSWKGFCSLIKLVFPIIQTMLEPNMLHDTGPKMHMWISLVNPIGMGQNRLFLQNSRFLMNASTDFALSFTNER